MMNKFLTSQEAADYLGIPEDMLLEIAERRKIPAYRIGGIYTRFKVEDLDSYRKKAPKVPGGKKNSRISDAIKDFFYFNDFYIFSIITAAVILYFILK